MKSRLKKGVTLTSLVVYVLLFATLTVFVANTYTNMNDKLFENRAKAFNFSSLNKLQENIENSSIESESALSDSNTISFSNNDKYVYDNASRCITKNGGILCTNVKSFTINQTNLNGVNNIQISVVFEKYLTELSRSIICSVEEL